MPRIARILAGLLAMAAIAVCPPVVQVWAGTLDWHIGYVAAPLALLCLALAAVAAAVLALRERIDARLARSFQTARHYQFLIVGLTIAGLLALALAELGLRVVNRPFKDEIVPSENAVARFDPDLGWSYRPSFATEQSVGAPPRTIELAFEAHGFRAARTEDTAKPGVPSLVLVGGSFMMGHGVSWPESLAGRLAARDDLPYPVVNLAVQGYGTDQALLRLRRHRPELEIAAVVYGFICGHVRRNLNADRRILFPGAKFLGTKPRFALDGRELVQVDWPARYEDLSYSRLWAFWEVTWTHYGPRPGLELTRALVGALAAEAKAAGAPLVVVNWQMGETAPEVCGPQPLGGLGLQVVRPAAEPPPGWSSWVIPGDFHPTARAHGHVADLVAARLADLGLAKTATTPPGGAR